VFCKRSNRSFLKKENSRTFSETISSLFQLKEIQHTRFTKYLDISVSSLGESFIYTTQEGYDETLLSIVDLRM